MAFNLAKTEGSLADNSAEKLLSVTDHCCSRQRKRYIGDIDFDISRRFDKCRGTSFGDSSYIAGRFLQR